MTSPPHLDPPSSHMSFDPESRYVTFTVQFDSGAAILYLDTGDSYPVEIAEKRPWRKRLLERPWLSHRVIRYDATIVSIAGVSTEIGPAMRFTMRIDSKEPTITMERK